MICKMSQIPIQLPKAILFDMDGTLTEPMLDFPLIKAEMGIGQRPILEALAELEGSRRQIAEAVLLRHETHAAENSTLNPGCRELLGWLRQREIPTAVITRNSRQSVDIVLARHRLSFEVLVTREQGPFKPDPYPLRLACKNLAASEMDVWMVGDGVFDIQAGAAAGIKTLWLSHGRTRSFDAVPWREIRDLLALHRLLQEISRGSIV
jgi:HAD superfamily hydrolase (TIGR01549 family)